MKAADPVRDFLREKGCPDFVVNKGLQGLIKSWENLVKSVRNGYEFGLDDYLNDVDNRQLLEEALTAAPPRARERYAQRVEQADKRMRALVKPAGKCLWGNEVAQTEGWTEARNWWYFSQPIQAARKLMAEIKKV
jgi:hypothetical protein